MERDSVCASKDSLDADDFLLGGGRKRHVPLWPYWVLWTSICCLIVALTVLAWALQLQSSNQKQCDQKLSSFFEYVDKQLDAALFTQNEYKGPPSPELDDAWASIVEMYPLSIPESAFTDLKKDPKTSVQFPAEHGGGYMAGLEVFHQLHCLQLVRQYTYKEYYANLSTPPQAFTDSEPVLRKHVDHCIDMIRQVLMCHSDITLVTHSWVDGYQTPFPDFNTWHKCRDFERISEFAAEAAIDVDIVKPAGVTGLAEAPAGHHHHGR